jgi:polyferredoxin
LEAPTGAKAEGKRIRRSQRRFWRMQNVRRISQLAFLALFLVLLALTVYPQAEGIPVDLFVRFDPLVALTALISARQPLAADMWWSLVVVGMTILLGRFFCGWVCPMGTAIDLSDRYIIRRKPDRGESRLRNLKYYILAGLLVAALFSAQLSYFLDPISLITRTVIWVVVSPVLAVAQWVAGQDWVYHVAPALAQTPLIPEIQPYYRQGLVAALLFGGILALGLASRRFWCRNLCPLGALLALLSKFGLVRRKVVGDACIDCGKCERHCKMGAIPSDPRQYQATECIYCYNCVAVCDADSTRFPITTDKEGFDTRLDLSRRRLLGAAAVGILWAALARTETGAKRAGNTKIKISSPQLIRPPGSRPEEEFLDRCTRCGLCMKACPTSGLQPALAEAGVEGLWSPVLVPRIGYCSQHCTLCGEVCPTEAIQPFTAEEKTYLYMGRAEIDRDTCLVWANDRECLVCDEVCSYRALHWKVVDGRRRPFVDEVKCTGCGECETMCPIQPVAAIRVTSLGDLRHLSREEQRAIRETVS